MNEGDALELILRSVVGIDLNPLAVMSARVNYLLAIADLLPYRKGLVEIPVYLADSILPPGQGEGLWGQGRRVLKTAVGNLPVPLSVNTRAELDKLANLLEEYVRACFQPAVFVERACGELGIAKDTAEAHALHELFTTLADLEQRGLNGIWARVLKNAFMPLFLEPFDYVVGNPPWVNWESLPEGYRSDSAPLWQEYGLFVHSGMDTILGKGKKDLSTLMTYAVAHRFLKSGGKLGFVITQSVFKTAGAGQGFRRFRIGQDGPPLRVLAVDDMNELQPFEGATNRTAIFVLQKGQATRYPVPYTYWKKAPGCRLDYDSTLQEAQSLTHRLNLRAMPVDALDPTSAWLTAREGALRAIGKVLGGSDYQAHAGVYSGGANAVYWLEILDQRPDGLLVVRNLTEGAKREAPQVTAEIEPDLVYPLLRGRDVSRWRAHPAAHMLMVQDAQTRQGIDEKLMQRRWPKTYAYLRRFEHVLQQRQSQSVRHLMTKGAFYSMFAVGDYTLAPFKVVWRYIASEMTACVVGKRGEPLTIPDHRLMLVPTDTPEEAHYIAAALNSSVGRFVVGAFVIGTQISAGVLEKVAVPRFSPPNPVHQRLAALSQRAHEVAGELSTDPPTDKRTALQQELAKIEAQVDQAAAQLWGITAQELAEVQRNLAELNE
jgi:hypothetical protein